MTKSITLLGAVIAVIFATAIGAGAQQTEPVKALLQLSKSAKPNFFEIQKANIDYINSIPETGKKPNKQFSRWEHFWRQRVDQSGNFPNPLKLIEELETMGKQSALPNPSKEYKWDVVGPMVSANPLVVTRSKGLGRINVVRLDPTNNNTIWVGFASGGVAKSTDAGKTWKHFEFTSSLSLGVADIAISPSNPDVVYVATGDCEQSSDKMFYSVGVIKTTNGGADWNFTNLAYYLNNWVNVARLLVQPDNPDIVIAATSSGILKSTNGGTNWVSKKSEGYIKDLEYKPTAGGRVVYASTMIWGANKVYRSVDFGESWDEVFSVAGTCRMNIEVTPADTNSIYAIAVTSYSYLKGIYMSTDGGSTWTTQATTPNILGRDYGNGNDATYGQGRYDLALAVNPSKSTEVWVGGINVWKSINSASTWAKKTHWYYDGSLPTIHADQHDLVFSADGKKLYAANDGGLYVTSDFGTNWTFLTDSLSYTQFYRFSVYDKSDKEKYLGGAQDNGTFLFNNDQWYYAMGGDGMQCIINPDNPDIMFGEIYYGDIDRSTNGGMSFVNCVKPSDVSCAGGDWVTPYVMSPINSNTLYVGYDYIVKSTDCGTTWTRLDKSKITSGYYTSLAVSAKDDNYIYANSYNVLKYSSNGGSTWSTISLPALNSGNKISWIQADPNNEKRFWVSLTNYDKGQKVLEYNNGTWTNISGNLPNVPVNCIAYQENSPDRLFAGTDVGLYYSEHGNGVWLKYGTGLPNTVVMDIKFGYAKNKIYVATFGRAIWQAPLIQCNMAQLPITVAGDTIVCKDHPPTLSAPDGYSSYIWSDGSAERTFTPTESGSYGVSVIDPTLGCLISSRIVTIKLLALDNLKIVAADNKTVLCGEIDSLTLYCPSSDFVSFVWSTGETSDQIIVRSEGIYTLTATNNNGCASVATFEVARSLNPPKPIISSEKNVLYSTKCRSYQWFLNGAKINGATSQSYPTMETGVYYLEAIDTNGCAVRSDNYSFEVGIHDDPLVISQGIRVVPNPNNGEFSIMTDNLAFPASVLITNTLGEAIFEATLSATDAAPYRINLGRAVPGVYFVYIKSAGRTFVEKFVKE